MLRILILTSLALLTLTTLRGAEAQTRDRATIRTEIRDLMAGSNPRRKFCQALFSNAPAKPAFVGDLPNDLLSFQKQEVENLTSREVSNLNQETLRQIESYVPPRSPSRAFALPFTQAFSLLSFIHNHPIASMDETDRYQPEDVEIGYCFGRAMFAHMMLLRLGVQRESIYKIWSVGPKTAGKITWSFHVATLVYTGRATGWMVIDPIVPVPQPLSLWVATYGLVSIDKKDRIYITEADRFGVNMPRYLRWQMGMDVDREHDWYRHYFVDLMDSVRGKSLEELGLSPAPRPRKKILGVF